MVEHNKKMVFTCITDVGRQRTNNEDAFVVQPLWNSNNILAVVIDGVGGYEGGEVAASIAQRAIVEYMENYPNGERLDILKQAVVYANNSIFEERKNQPNLANMSCVLTAVLIEEDAQLINMVHIGDTRLYQYQRGELKKLSHDHSLIGYREEVGDLTEEEAMNHPQRNIINRDVGSAHHEVGDRDFLEATVFPLLSNSILMLCSDGLSDMLTTEQMKQLLQSQSSLEEKAKTLIDAANEAKGNDNITVVLLDYKNDESEEDIYPADEAPIREIVGDQKPIQLQQPKQTSVMKSIFKTIIILLMGLILGWIARGKYGSIADESQIIVIPDTVAIKHDSLRLFVLDSLVIVNDTDTLQIHTSLSTDINGIWTMSANN